MIPGMSSLVSFPPVTDSPTLDAWIARSHREPVVIFKHSLTCGTSAAAYEEVERFASGPHALAIALVIVQQHRAVSNEIAQRLGLAHHSPQALLIVGGRVHWHASHWRITEQALNDAAAAAPPAGS